MVVGVNSMLCKDTQGNTILSAFPAVVYSCLKNSHTTIHAEWSRMKPRGVRKVTSLSRGVHSVGDSGCRQLNIIPSHQKLTPGKNPTLALVKTLNFHNKNKRDDQVMCNKEDVCFSIALEQLGSIGDDFELIGFWVYLQNLPDEFEINPKNIQAKIRKGRSKTLQLFNKLSSRGLLRKERHKHENGRYKSVTYTLVKLVDLDCITCGPRREPTRAH